MYLRQCSDDSYTSEVACINTGSWQSAFCDNVTYTTQHACVNSGNWNSTDGTCNIGSGGRETSEAACTASPGTWTAASCSINSGGRQISESKCVAPQAVWSCGALAGQTFTTTDNLKAGIIKETTNGPNFKYIMTKGSTLGRNEGIIIESGAYARTCNSNNCETSGLADTLTVELSAPDGVFVDAKADKNTVLKIQNTFSTSGYPDAAAKDRSAQFVIENSVASGSKTTFTQEVCGGSPGGTSCGARVDKWSLRSQFGGGSLSDTSDRIRVAADSSVVSRTITQCQVSFSGTVAEMTTNAATDTLAVGDLVTISGMSKINTIVISVNEITVSNNGLKGVATFNDTKSLKLLPGIRLLYQIQILVH